VDLPNDGSDPTFDGRDGIVDGTDDNTVVITNPCDSRLPASQQLKHDEWVEDDIVPLSEQINNYEAMHYKMPVVSWCRSFLIGQSMALSFDGRTDIQ
jgi:hypothetical protein